MKFYLIALLAALTAGIFAFAPVSEKKYNQQFKYIGPIVNPDYTDPNNWTTSELEPCDSSGQIKCLVTPVSNSILTPEDLVTEITNNGFMNIITDDTRP